MRRKQFGILCTLLILFFASQAQSYKSKYEICSRLLRHQTLYDSVFYASVKTRDSCLLGVSAPNFQAITLDNKKISLTSLKGQVVLLNFWFTHCEPCIEEMPGFNKLAAFYKNKKVTFISVTYDSSTMVRKFLKQYPFNFITVANNDDIRRNDFKLISVWPYTIIIDKDGKIRFLQYGTKGTQSFSYFKAMIDKLL